MAHENKRTTVKVTGYGFYFHSNEIKCLIFLFPRSGNEVQRGVEFRRSTRNASRTWSDLI